MRYAPGYAPAMSVLMLYLAACAAVPAPPIVEIPAPGAFPHRRWTVVLERFVDDAGRVDYKGLQQDRIGIDGYTARIAAISPESHPELFPSRADQLAYWINAYNALAITGVIDRPGLQSVNASKIVLTDFFYLTRYPVGGKKYALATIENSIVRPGFNDPRTHFALNCDSVGCPRLPREAFEPARLDAQLDQYSREFVTDPAKVRVEDVPGKGRTIMISQIFEWYAGDFTGSGGPVGFINLHGGDVPTDLPVGYIPYDWSLIAQEGRGP